ncbi:hypothetical protein PR048_029461 [Dryococelus australis]|uniref:Uncharacterized protein n=1 Tax=Dryococelus australis TaxID=614101 RepID=A0ABQ9GDE0_9NEOP|nr:hypothetical protein PR048_029461 [Dryococelus australis]
MQEIVGPEGIQSTWQCIRTDRRRKRSPQVRDDKSTMQRQRRRLTWHAHNLTTTQQYARRDERPISRPSPRKKSERLASRRERADTNEAKCVIKVGMSSAPLGAGRSGALGDLQVTDKERPAAAANCADVNTHTYVHAVVCSSPLPLHPPLSEFTPSLFPLEHYARAPGTAARLAAAQVGGGERERSVHLQPAPFDCGGRGVHLSSCSAFTWRRQRTLGAEFSHMPRPPLRLFKGDTATRINSPIAAKRKALNWRTVFSSCSVCLWDFQRRSYYFVGGKCVGRFNACPSTSFVWI